MKHVLSVAAGLLVACGGASRDAPIAQEPRLRAAPPSADLADADPPKPLFDLDEAETAALDARMSRVRPRRTALLLVEIKGLQSLLSKTPESAGDRPQLLRRLAEDDVELAAAGEREATAAAPGDDAAARRFVAVRGRRAAIATYRALIEDRACPQLDEVEWYLALEYARAGDGAGARSAGTRLMTDRPDSPYTARVSFLFGAMLAAEAESDPARYALAEQAFAKAAQSSDGSLEVVALRRLENAARAAGDTAAANEAARSLQTAESPSARSRVPSALTMSQQGCTKDIECKGDRICEGRKCVAPR